MRLVEIENRGLYVRANLSDDSKKRLAEWMNDIGLQNPVDPSKFHVTLVYSRKPVSGFESIDSYDEPVVVSGPYSFDMFDEGKVLVMKMKSADLTKRWQDAIDCGATWDYPEYNPHVPLSYDAEGFDVNTIETPDFDLEIVGETSKPLDVSWNG